MNMSTSNICLVIHCIRNPEDAEPKVNRELFINLSDIDVFIKSLKNEGYRFVLPCDVEKTKDPTCCLTFDDGYYNNHHFLELAEKHNIPFILFLTSYNVVNRLPFIWDIWAATRKERWPIVSIDYLKLYEQLNPSERDILNNDSHRPFTQEELEAFSANPLVHLAPHGHTHQPIVGHGLAEMENELEKNLFFLKRFKSVLPDEFALPCGLHTVLSRRKLLAMFRRIYTIDGGGNSPGDRLINRISLISPEYGGALMSQIRTSFKLMPKLKRRIVTSLFSYGLLRLAT
jgi:peptidoglycan/xylan/chitin deacetylase (PgdA/CDA1 family)